MTCNPNLQVYTLRISEVLSFQFFALFYGAKFLSRKNQQPEMKMSHARTVSSVSQIFNLIISNGGKILL